MERSDERVNSVIFESCEIGLWGFFVRFSPFPFSFSFSFSFFPQIDGFFGPKLTRAGAQGGHKPPRRDSSRARLVAAVTCQHGRRNVGPITFRGRATSAGIEGPGTAALRCGGAVPSRRRSAGALGRLRLRGSEVHFYGFAPPPTFSKQLPPPTPTPSSLPSIIPLPILPLCPSVKFPR